MQCMQSLMCANIIKEFSSLMTMRNHYHTVNNML